MSWYPDSSFLLRWAGESCVVAAVASTAVLILRQPATRLRVIQWSFVACLLLAGLPRLDGGPRWSLSWRGPARPAENSRHAAAPLAENAPEAAHAPAGAEPLGPRPTNVAPFTPVPPTTSAATDRPAGVRAGRFRDGRQVAVAGYLSGVLIMSAWWLAGYAAMKRLLRRSQPCDERCQAILREVAGGGAAGVRLVESGSAAQPFVSGCLRPAIVLPLRLARGDAVALRCVLAHEWSHVARGDTWWWSLAGLVRVVCFFQPLVWWLRGQMRLAQDCLADAEAAAQAPTPEDYAQLLTAWAANRLLPSDRVSTSLGILGRKSDLYRRIVMLVQNATPIDRRCPSRSNAGIAFCALVLLVSAATYGGAEDTPRQETKQRERASQATAKSPQQVRLDQLVDGVLGRARAVRSGRFQFRRTINGAVSGPFDDAPQAHLRLSFSGGDWAIVQSADGGFDYMVRRAGRLMTLRSPRSPQDRAELRIESPLFLGRLDVLMVLRAGTLPSEALDRFIDGHRYDARLAVGEPMQGFPRTTRMEWNVVAADAGVFGGTSDLLSGGGLLRIDVAEEDGYVLPQVEYVDRFGGVEARFLAGSFVEVAHGLTFPEQYSVSQNAEIHYEFRNFDRINKPLPDDDFELRSIPAGTRVRDLRPRKGPDGKRLDKPGPLQDFTLGAVYGLPKEMLAAMDEGVLSEEETKKALETSRPDASANDNEAERQAIAERKKDLRYAGRTFEDWRQKLLNDLDPSTCTNAMPPIAAFGQMGYAQEAVAALTEILRSDRAAERANVADHAVAALTKIGAPAAPALIEGLADATPNIRAQCAQSLAQLADGGMLGESRRAAGEALLRLLRDKTAWVRASAAGSLVAVVDDDVLRSTFERLAESDEAQVLASFLRALNRHTPNGDWWVETCLRLADDEDRDVRMAVGAVLANHGRPEKRVIKALEELMQDDDDTVAMSPVVSLSQGDGNNVPLLVAVLTDAIKSAKLWNRFREGQVNFAITRLGDAPQHADASVPLLVEIAEMRIPNWNDEPLNAIDALGKLGPAAKAAFPVLERWISRDDVADDDTYKRHARRAVQKIIGATEAAARADQNGPPGRE